MQLIAPRFLRRSLPLLAATVAALIPSWATTAAARPAPPPDAHVAIIGGTDAPAGEWPWMTALLLEGPNTPQAALARTDCGGALIAPTVVLTAAHCVTDLRTGRLDPDRLQQAVLGRNDLRAAGGEVLDIAEVAVHPQWDPDPPIFDVALLRLATPSAATPATIASATLPLAESDLATVRGWGVTGRLSRAASPVLQTVDLPLWSNSRCARAWGVLHVPSVMLCADTRDGHASTCSGDSGGPLMVRVSGSWQLVGLVSFGSTTCATRGRPPNFTWAASPYIRGWIVAKAQAFITGDPDRTAPRLSRFTLRGRTVRFRLSEAGQVVGTVARRTRRRTVVLPRTLAYKLSAGSNQVHLPARLNGRPLRAGRYLLELWATDKAGNQSRIVDIPYTIR